MNKKLLPLVWVISVIGIAILANTLEQESSHFFGIADDHEQTISFSYPVEIVQTFAVEGGEVMQGSQILEVRRSDLASKLAIIDEQIQAMKSSSEEERGTTQAKLYSLRAQRAAELAEVDGQIKNLLAEQRLNEKLLKQISGKKTTDLQQSPLFTKIEGLREQRRHIEMSMEAQMVNLEQQLGASVRPSDSRLAELEERKHELQRQFTDLKVNAKFNGRVGSVNFKSGEIVAPFQPVLTVHGLSPRFIKGYIHENVFNEVAINQQVWVRSNTSSNHNEAISAVVESLGSRIVEYPVRLKKNLMVSAWGREVVVRLTDENQLLLGEKVIVSLNDPDKQKSWVSNILVLFSSISQSVAATNVSKADGAEGYPIRSMLAGLKDQDIEASGIIPALTEGHYFLVNDETLIDQAELFEINTQGELLARMPIQTEIKVDDLESISRDDSAVYVLASMDKNKKDRRHFLRLKVSGDSVITTGQVNLYKRLKALSTSSTDSATRQFLSHALKDKSIQIEAHNVYQNNLYLGFKTPLNERNETVILKIENVDKILSGEEIDGKIWRSISLLNPQTGSPALLSDLLFYEDRLLLLGVSKDEGRLSSHLWSYQYETESLRTLKSFNQLRAEGVVASTDKNRVVVVFDGGGNHPSRFLTITL